MHRVMTHVTDFCSVKFWFGKNPTSSGNRGTSTYFQQRLTPNLHVKLARYMRNVSFSNNRMVFIKRTRIKAGRPANSAAVVQVQVADALDAVNRALGRLLPRAAPTASVSPLGRLGPRLRANYKVICDPVDPFLRKRRHSGLFTLRAGIISGDHLHSRIHTDTGILKQRLFESENCVVLLEGF